MSQTPSEQPTFKTYVKPNNKTYRGFIIPEIHNGPQSSQGSKRHILSTAGQPLDINYLPNGKNVPRNILAIPTRPDVDSYKTFEEYEAAWLEWKAKMENFTSHYRLPTVMGSEINVPKNDGKVLVEDPWDALLIPAEPNVCDYESYESYKTAMERWINEVSNVGFLPPHANEIENALFERKQGIKKKDGNDATQDGKVAEFEGFAKEKLCVDFEMKYDLKNCVKQPVKTEFDENNRNKFASKLKDSSVLKKIKDLKEKMKIEDVIDGSKTLSKVSNQNIHLENILSGNNNGENNQPIGERLFKTNKASQIFKTIVQKSIEKMRIVDPSKATGQENDFIQLVQSNQFDMETIFNLFIFTAGFNDFFMILNSSIGVKKVGQILFEFITSNTQNVEDFYNFITFTTTNVFQMKMSLFARDMLLEDGKKLIQYGLLSPQLQNKMTTLFYAASMHGYGKLDIFEYKAEVAEKMKNYVAKRIVEYNAKKQVSDEPLQATSIGNLIEDVFTIYYMIQIIGDEGRSMKLNEYIIPLINALKRSEKEIKAFVKFVPEMLMNEELSSLTLFLLLQFITFIGDAKYEYMVFIKEQIKAIDILPLIISQGKKHKIKQYEYIISLFVSKVLTCNEIRVEFFSKLTTKIEIINVYQFCNILSAETDINFLKLIVKIMRTVISEMPKINTSEDYFNELTGSSFFEAVSDKVDENFTYEETKPNGTIEIKKDDEYNCVIVELLKSIVKHNYIKKTLGKKMPSDTKEKLNISRNFVENKLLKKLTDSLKNDKKKISQRFFRKILDLLRYVYKVPEQFYPLIADNNNLLDMHSLISSYLVDLKEKAEPSLLKSLCKMNLVFFKMTNTVVWKNQQAIIETPTDKNAMKSNEKIQQRLGYFIGDGFKMIELKNDNKPWPYINLFLKDTSLAHGEIMLTFLSEMLNMACEFKTEKLSDRMKKFLSQQFFTDSTALKMFKQEMENTEIAAKQYNTFKKGYNCISYPGVMRVAFTISQYQHDNIIIKVSTNAQKERFVEVIPKTGKPEDSKGAILEIRESETIYNMFRNHDVNGLISGN